MKHAREIKVGVLAIVCAGILYFGFNFLKGVNIFSPTRCYLGQYERVNGLTEQAPVYIRGYKVGLVESIQYDFTRDMSFVVAVSIDKGIELPKGTQMALVADGLLGGMAIELCVPKEADITSHAVYHRGDTLPTIVVPGLLDGLQTGLLAHLDGFAQQRDVRGQPAYHAPEYRTYLARPDNQQSRHTYTDAPTTAEYHKQSGLHYGRPTNRCGKYTCCRTAKHTAETG